MKITDFTSQHVNGLWTCTVTVTEANTSHCITGYECPDESIKLDSCSCRHYARMGTCAHSAFARDGLNATAQAAYQARMEADAHKASAVLTTIQDARVELENHYYYGNGAGIVPARQTEQEAA